MGKFKVGDRVRSLDDGYSIFGRVGTIVRVSANGYDAEFGTDWGPLFHTEEELEFAEPKPDPESPTLRDQFAMAFIGPLTKSLIASDEIVKPDEFARNAYVFADAMLKAREAK